MKRGSAWLWIVRVSWLLLGGVWSAWLGFGGYLRLPHNADSFATMIAGGFFGAFALVGLGAGMAVAALSGGLTERLARLLGADSVGAVCIASIVSVLALWQVSGWVQTRYPGIGAPAARPPTSQARTLPAPRPCEHPPAENSPERASWDSECR